MSKNKSDLRDKISKAQAAYHNGEAIISDDEYDALIYELSLIDPNDDVLLNVGSEPTSKEWTKLKHPQPLGSLNKVNLPSEMSAWINKNLKNKPVVVMDKLDGLSIGCHYVNDELVSACLRGNGLVGENILKNALKMQGCEQWIENFTGVLRGEIVLTKSNHKKHFSDYSNPRNAASGICRRSDGVGCEHLSIIFYQTLGSNYEFKTEVDQLNFLHDNELMIPNYKLCHTNEEVNLLWQEYQDTTRESLDYEIDGLVVACNDLDYQQSLGETNLRSKGKMAFKFANQYVSTTVTDIKWVTGNSGRVTPVCWFKPVNLLGSMVEKASLYNVAYINRLGIDIGADVLICKANEIIPRVESVIKSTNTIALPPEHCSECNSLLVQSGEYLLCTNTATCPAQTSGRIKIWISDLNIMEWGDALIDRLVESGKVNTVADLYRLSIDDLMSIDRMGDKSAKKCHKLLWDKTTIPLDIFLGALGIPLIGSSTIRQIVGAGCDTVDKFLNEDAEFFKTVSGVGPSRAESLYNGLQSNRQLINEILTLGVKMAETNKDGKLNGKKFCFTGAMENKRKDLEQMVVDNGGEVKSVGAGLTYLVTNDNDSTTTKMMKAIKLGIKIITEKDFLKMVQ